MTREELNKKKVLLSLNNKKYEKVAHSGTENFLAFRKKVLEGRAKMDALKRQSEMFNVTEANDKHYNDLVNNGMLIHAQSPMYGEQRQDVKYYKREGDPGHYRYYYTKEEYDAAHKSPQSGMEKVQQMHNEKESNLQGMIKDGDYYEKGEDGKFHKTDKKWEDVREQAIKEADDKIINAAKEGGYEAAKKAIFDDERMDEMFGQFEGGFENHGWKLNDDGSITGMDEDDEKYFKDMEIWMRSFKDKTGIDIYKNKDFQKSVMDEIRNRYNMINNQTKERESKIEGTKKYAAPEGVGKNEEASTSNDTANNIKKAADDAVKSVNETARKSDFNSKLNDTITNEGSDATADYIINNSPEWKEMVQAYKQAVNDGYIKMYRDGGKTVKDKGSKEIRDKFDPIFEKFEAVMQEAAKNPDFDRKGVEKLLNNELDNVIMEATENKYGVRDNTKKLAHEDSDPNTITTSEPLTPEQEYLNFKAKVEAGMKKQEAIRHSMFIKSAKKQEAPKPIKPVYDNNKFDFYANVKKFKEEHPNTLSHSQNFKYYNKIDLGNGKSRYFYTKAEWDAYQDEQEQSKKGSSTGGVNLKTKNASMYEDLAKKAHEKENLEKQQKDTFEKNKAAEEAQKKAESDKWNTHKKIREDFHQVPGYMSYSSRFTDTMKETPEGSKKGKEYLFNVMYDAYNKYPKMKNIRTISSNQKDKPKDEEVFGFMDEIQKGIDKYTSDFINKYQLPKEEYTPLINNYFLSMANNLMKENALDYDYISDVYYRNSDVGKKEAVKEEILKQGHFNNRIFREDYKNKFNKYNEIFDKDYDRDSEVYKSNLQNFAENGPECKYLKESIEELKNRRTADGKQQYSDEDIYNAAYTFLWKNFQKQAVDSDFAFSPDLYKLIPDIMNAMGYKGSYTADPQDLILKIK